MKNTMLLLLMFFFTTAAIAQESEESKVNEEVKKELKEAVKAVEKAVAEIDKNEIKKGINEIMIEIEKFIDGIDEDKLKRDINIVLNDIEDAIDEIEVEEVEEDLDDVLDAIEEALEGVGEALEEVLEDLDEGDHKVIRLGDDNKTKIIIKHGDDEDEMEVTVHEHNDEVETEYEYEDEVIIHEHDDDDHKHKKHVKAVKTRWLMLDLGLSSYENNNNFTLSNGIDPFEQDLWKSRNWNFHIFRQRINLVQNHVNLMYGLTFDWHNYAFENDVTILPNEPSLTISYDEGINYDKNRLRVSYMTVPLMLNFETNPRKRGRSLRINAGVYGSLRIGSKLMQESDSLDEVVRKDDFNLSKYRYGFIGEVGLGPINFYGTYALNGLFEEGQEGGADITPYSVGIKIIPF